MSTILDMQILDELLALSDEGDPELLLDLVDMFLADAPTKLKDVVEGLRQQDWRRIELAVHALKGTSGSLGAMHVMADCEAILTAVRSGQHPAIPPQAKRLAVDLLDADSALREFTSNLR